MEQSKIIDTLETYQPPRNFSWYLLTLLSKFSLVTIRELLFATFPGVIYQISDLLEASSSEDTHYPSL